MSENYSANEVVTEEGYTVNQVLHTEYPLIRPL